MLDQPKQKTPHAIDVHVGSRIRLQRVLMGMSQSALAEGLGVTFQQVQKYEKGTNRVGSSRLQAIANILGVPVAFFFQQGPDVSAQPQKDGSEESEEIAQFLTSSEGIALNRSFTKIKDARVRRTFVRLVEALANSG
ncbi:helix-turn-helix domain-containing protein [Sinorhizobium alkalisoli]|uniref:helix-turn-helix domain-containing protein n=1 Tax=Sinorhizobium alkalisoli TaxID=1752398 RepID=UPI00124CC691|nr:helix-turn-helix transcriptional regulator [Sinorhizobium alkalisoli]QFI68705.1 Transcriptional regulator, Cro/CI family [Sinorhizobium alkalisoli]